MYLYVGDMASYITWQNFVLCLPLFRVVHSGMPNTKHHLAGYKIEGAATTKKRNKFGRNFKLNKAWRNSRIIKALFILYDAALNL
jgi:predicted nucleic acid-binding Zn finger protein